MTELEQKVWKAIEEALFREGDADIRAGLAWLEEDGEQRIAQAAIEAMETQDAAS